MLMHLRGDGCMGGHGDKQAPSEAACRVCGAKVKISDRTPRATHAGSLYYFDSEEHLREFVKEPAKFPGKPPESPESHSHHGGER